MSKNDVIAKALDPSVTNLGSLGVALAKAAQREASVSGVKGRS